MLSAEQVSAKIREAILKGDLKPGDKLNEQALAAEYEVSRTPIREAIRQLEAECLVSRTRYVGVTVAQLKPGEIIELLDIREVLEGLMARLAATQMQAAERKRLRKAFTALRAAGKAERVIEYLDAAFVFRRILAEACRSQTLIHYVMGIENRLRLMGNRTAMIPGRMVAAVDEHEAVLKAIENGDPVAAEESYRNRIRQIKADVQRAMSYSLF